MAFYLWLSQHFLRLNRILIVFLPLTNTSELVARFLLALTLFTCFCAFMSTLQFSIRFYTLNYFLVFGMGSSRQLRFKTTILSK